MNLPSFPNNYHFKEHPTFHYGIEECLCRQYFAQIFTTLCFGLHPWTLPSSIALFTS